MNEWWAARVCVSVSDYPAAQPERQLFLGSSSGARAGGRYSISIRFSLRVVGLLFLLGMGAWAAAGHHHWFTAGWIGGLAGWAVVSRRAGGRARLEEHHDLDGTGSSKARRPTNGMESPHLFNNNNNNIVPVATFGFQLWTVSFSPEICNLAAPF